jgi:hypothetical protein
MAMLSVAGICFADDNSLYATKGHEKSMHCGGVASAGRSQIIVAFLPHPMTESPSDSRERPEYVTLPCSDTYQVMSLRSVHMAEACHERMLVFDRVSGVQVETGPLKGVGWNR